MVHSLRKKPGSIPAVLQQDVPSERHTNGQIIITDRSGQRIVEGVSRLFRCGEINNIQVAAADRWYKDYVLGIIGVRNSAATACPKQPDIHAAMLSRINAITRCRIVRNSLGSCSEYRLRLLLVDDMSFSAIATIYKMTDTNGRKKVAAQMVLLLEQLAEVYRRIDDGKSSALNNI